MSSLKRLKIDLGGSCCKYIRRQTTLGYWEVVVLIKSVFESKSISSIPSPMTIFTAYVTSSGSCTLTPLLRHYCCATALTFRPFHILGRDGKSSEDLK